MIAGIRRDEASSVFAPGTSGATPMRAIYPFNTYNGRQRGYDAHARQPSQKFAERHSAPQHCIIAVYVVVYARVCYNRDARACGRQACRLELPIWIRRLASGRSFVKNKCMMLSRQRDGVTAAMMSGSATHTAHLTCTGERFGHGLGWPETHARHIPDTCQTHARQGLDMG